MTEKDIQKLLVRKYNGERNHKILLPNVYFFNWESDLLSVTQSNNLWEFEIKCSRHDYKNDFKKTEKHKQFTLLNNIDTIPNRFYYVAPEGLITVDDVPEYAGLIIVKKNGLNKYLKELKNAPILHKEKMDSEKWENMALKLFYKLAI